MNKAVLRLLPLFVLSLAMTACAAPDLAATLHEYARESHWRDSRKRPVIDRTSLVNAIEMARAFYLNQQKQQGNFVYAVDISNGDVIDKDNQVRQAGALWGLASLNRDRFNEPTRRAVLLGIDFFARTVTTLKTGEKCFIYPNSEDINTGTVALFSLSLIEFLRGQEKYLNDKDRARYRGLLETHLAFLRTMERADGSWALSYNVPTGVRAPETSPYYDGEALLAYCKAARYCGFTELMPRINAALPRLIRKYTLDCWGPDGDTDDCKGFYQWGCMSIAEYVEAGWTPHAALATDAALALSWWLIHDNRVEVRNGNTGYAVEGLIGAWRTAKVAGDTASCNTLHTTVMNIMSNLMTWQYKGPFMNFNPTLMALKDVPARMNGGITTTRDSTFVRIDIHQHQLHAMLLMLQYFFPKK